MKEKPFVLYNYEITLEKANDYFTLVPFSDVHYDDDSCDRKLFDEFCEETQQYHNPIYLGVGDYNDWSATSDQKKLKALDLHNTTMREIEKVGVNNLMEFKRKIEFMRGRLIGLIGGNHDWVFEDGFSGTEKLCQHLDCKYLGNMAIISITIKYPRTKKSSKVDICLCHGQGGGQLLGSQINKIEKMALIYPEASIFLQGHNHGRGGLPDQVLQKVNIHGEPHLRYRTRYYARTGSFQRGYTDGVGTFASSKTMRPANLGWIRFEVQPKREQMGSTDFMYNKITQIT